MLKEKLFNINIFKFLNQNALYCLITWIILLSILYSSLSIIRHNNFQSGAFDLGLYDQALWQYSKFQYPFNTIKNRIIFGDHLTLTLPLLAPLYWIWDNVKILLIFQAIWVSISALPFFLLIKNRGYSSIVGLNLSFIYSLFYGIQFIVFFDFHPISIAVGLIAWMLFFLETNRKRLFILTFILLLLTQENMGFALASIGFVYILQKKYRRLGLIFIVSGIIASIMAVQIIKLISPIGFEYTPEVESNPIKLFLNFFDAPDKRNVWLYSFSWYSFVPLLSPGAILGITFDLAQYFVTGKTFERMWSPFMHHRGILASILLLGTLDGFNLLKKIGKRIFSAELISFIMVIVALFFQFYFHFALNKLSKSIYWKTETWMDDNKRLFVEIPSSASIAAAQNIVPHLSHRSYIYLAYPALHEIEGDPCGKKLCWWLDFAGKPELLIVDLHPNQWVTQLLESNENFGEAINNMEKVNKITLIKQINYAKMYKINY